MADLKPMKMFKVFTFGSNYDLNIAESAVDALRQSMFRHNRGWTLGEVAQVCACCREEMLDDESPYCKDESCGPPQLTPNNLDPSDVIRKPRDYDERYAHLESSEKPMP